MSKKALTLIFSLLFLLVISACSAKESESPSPSSAPGTPAPTPEITSGTTIPEGFPSDIPLATDAKIQTSIKQVGATKVIYSVAYGSKQSLEDLRGKYKSFLDAGYQDVQDMGTEHQGMLSGTQNNGDVTLTVSIMQVQDQQQVNLQYSMKK